MRWTGKVPVFEPTVEQFGDFAECFHVAEKMCAEAKTGWNGVLGCLVAKRATDSPL